VSRASEAPLIIQHDDREHSNKTNSYIDCECRTGTEKYASAVASIFSPETAQADLIKCTIKDDKTIELLWRLEGVISQGGFQFKFKPYTGKTVYSLSDETGKIVRQDETWDISQLDVFVGLFFPQLGAPAAPPAGELRQKYA